MNSKIKQSQVRNLSYVRPTEELWRFEIDENSREFPHLYFGFSETDRNLKEHDLDDSSFTEDDNPIQHVARCF